MSSLQRKACGAAVFVLLAQATPGWSQTLPLAPAATTEPAPPTAAASTALDLVRRELETRKAVDATDRAALAAWYGEANRAPIWVENGKLTARAVAAVGELRKAGDYGLNAQSFETPDPAGALATPEAAASAEVTVGLAVLKYARQARGGRIDVGALGRNFDQKPPLLEPRAVIEGIAAASESDAYLRGLHPKHPQFEKLRKALLATRAPAPTTDEKAPGADIKIPAGPRVKPGQSHPQVALLRQRLNVTSEVAAPQVLDETLAAATREFQQAKGINPDGVLNNLTRTALNGASKPVTAADQTQRILVNMERWRWLPEDLGIFHVWDNIPEYRMRVMKDGQVAHTESIIVGKPSTPTPVFSADMKYVIFHPNWGVPDGIKMNEIAPALRRSSSNSFFNWGESSDPAILRRHNLRVSYNGRPVDASKIDWSTADIRQYQFTQPPSASNVLGVVKFRFPNKHDVYMHDTPERSLFSRAEKAFSHGCMRVHNPQKLAEVLLAEDQNWTPAQVRSAIAGSATQDVTLSKRIPVHVTYFTAIVEDDGKLKTFGDIYGHDSRIASALEGKSVKLIAQTDPAVKAEREVQKRSGRTKTAQKSSGGGGGGLFDIFSGLAGN